MAVLGAVLPVISRRAIAGGRLGGGGDCGRSHSAGFASIYPTTLGLAGSPFERHSGTVFGIIFAIALIGGMVLSWGVGQLARDLGLRIGLTYWLFTVNPGQLPPTLRRNLVFLGKRYLQRT